MTTRILFASGILAAGIVYAVVAQEPPSAGLDFGDAAISRNLNRIERALHETTECPFKDNPLEEAMNFLEDRHHIKIWIDKQALQDEGITTDQYVTLQISGVTLQSALSLMLEPLGMTHVTEDEVLKITTQAKADEKFSVRVYPMADLLSSGGSPDDYESLIQVLMQSTSGKWMEIDQEGGTVTPFPNARSLVIRQTEHVHREIEGILAALRRAKQLQRIASIPATGGDFEIQNPVEPSSPIEPRVRTRTQRATQTWQRPRVYSAE
jgi:hypothetical protein